MYNEVYMNKRTTLFAICGLILFIFALNLVASRFFWYSIIPWFDNLMHFFGGLWLGLTATFVVISYHPFKKKNAPSGYYLFVSLLLALIASIYWEVFEFGVQNIIQFVHLADIPDSLTDILFDILGWSVGYLVLRRYIPSKDTQSIV